ncbi:MAG: Polynucleotide adenylyltransferase region [Alphaproteobacteria bacterium]|nr:Polynucleotide adenylyltransferase region [Alphaproteobacteria bacterium]
MKLPSKLPDARWQQKDGLKRLLSTLGAEQGETRYVGGCVRDTLLGMSVSDVDLATRLQPEEVIERLGRARIKAIPTGLAHGTVTAVLREGLVEVTTLRRDVATDGRHATVAFTEEWRDDAARRDFTINALFADPTSGAVFDYFSGLDDLEAGRVRFIGDPLRRIAEDHLRILRFFRFHARFGNDDPDAAALAACSFRANDLMALSRERIADELLKLLGLPDPAQTLALMVEHAILRPVLPEIGGDGVQRLAVLTAREGLHRVPADAIRRLAALLPPDPMLAVAVANRLKLSKKDGKRLAAAADPALPEADPQVLAYEIGGTEAIDRLLLRAADDALGDGLARLAGWEKPRLPVGGSELIAMGLKPGPLVSRALRAIEHEWVRSGFRQDRESIERLARRHVDQLLRASQ